MPQDDTIRPRPKPGRPTNKKAVSSVVQDIPEDRLPPQLSRKRAGSLLLKDVVTVKPAILELAHIFPRTEEMIAAFCQIDVHVIYQLSKSRMLQLFLAPDDVSITWMFAELDSQEYKSGLAAWPRKALDGRRALFESVLRFWNVFERGGIRQKELVDLARSLGFVAIASGNYREALKILSYWESAHGDLRNLGVAKSLEHIEVLILKGFAAGCLNWSQNASAYFRRAGTLIHAFSPKRPRRRWHADSDLRDTDVQPLAKKARLDHAQMTELKRLERALCRERLRFLTRPEWRKLAEWPPLLSERTRTKLGDAVDYLEELCERGMGDPIDYDSLARGYLFLAPKEENGRFLLDAWHHISAAFSSYELRKDNLMDQEPTQASLTTLDSLLATRMLYYIAIKDESRCAEDYLRYEELCPESERVHTLLVCRVIQNVGSRRFESRAFCTRE